MNTGAEALKRTTLLINRELFGGKADQSAIADALVGGTVSLRGDRSALESRAGQSALITAFMLIARLGVAVDFDVPHVSVIDEVEPIRKGALGEALLDFRQDLIPGQRIVAEQVEPDATFVIGGPAATDTDIVVSVDDFSFSMTRAARQATCAGNLPFGGFAAGAAMAAVALDALVPELEKATGLNAQQPRPVAGPPAAFDLRNVFPSLSADLALGLGNIDAVSGGAITNALIYCLLRVPGCQATVRVIEADTAELSNLNRYALLRASQLGRGKIDLLEEAATRGIKIKGVSSLFTPETKVALAPLADRVVVGADNVEARWWVQEAKPKWLAIGATGNQLAQLTTHLPGTPCARCLHPVPLPPQEIPTISFVSFWAGLLQACALLEGSAPPLNITVYPFALGGTMGVVSTPPVAREACPICCAA